MIELVKNSTISFLLKVDKQGIEEMLAYIKELKSHNIECLQVLYSGNKRNFEIILDIDANEMLIGKTAVKMYMDSEEMEYLEERLKDALISRCFYPAEICERKYQNIYVTIYCIIV